LSADLPPSPALKVDIEGSEWDLFDEFFADELPMPFSEILVELHVPKLGTTSAQKWGADTPTRMQCESNLSRGTCPHALRVEVPTSAVTYAQQV
jgi:hypothetical protein